MAVNELQDVLWANWGAWATGGLSDAEIDARVSKEDCAHLHREISAIVSDPAVQHLSCKALIDIATWVVHGTHSLLLLPDEIRRGRFAQAADTIGVNQQILVELFQAPHFLHVS